MSRVRVNIDQAVLRGFERADSKALLEGLQTELSRVLADPGVPLRSHRTPALNLGGMPLARSSGSRILGTRIGRAIGKELKP